MVITVSGARASVGKTRFIELLLPVLRATTAVKVRADTRRAAVKYEETNADDNPGKDTARYLAAGAERAFLLTGPSQEALALARQVIQEASSEVVLFETDSLAEALKPDLTVFVAGEGEWKPGAERCRRIADVVVNPRPGRGERPPPDGR